MKRLFLFMVMSMATFAFSCSTDEAVGTLGLTSSNVMRFPQEGGEGVINYTIQGVQGGAKIGAVCESDWVTITEVANEIKFTVSPNDLDEERTALILVTYAQQSVQVIVEQAGAPDVEFVAQMLNGDFDKKSSVHPDAYKYTVVLSKYGTTSDTKHPVDDCFYKFYLYSSIPASADPYVAWGEYIYDASSTYFAGTFADDLSEYVAVDKQGKETHLKIKAGKVVISDNNIEALITLENDEVHHVVYNGSLNLYYLSFVEKGPYSTLTEDYNFNIESGAMTLAYYGDEYGVGRGSWDIFFMEQRGGANGDYFRFAVVDDVVEYNQETVYGEYVADTTSTFAAGTFVPGYKFNGNNIGAWYILAANGYYTNTFACIVDGSIKIEPEGEENVVVTVDVVDDNGKKLTGVCRCTYIELYNRVGM